MSKQTYNHLKNIQKDYVFTTVDKASQNFAIICKQFYIKQLAKELGIQQHMQLSKTYQMINIDKEILINKLVCESQALNVHVDKEMFNIPFIQIIPKFHKTPLKFRTIIASSKCVTKPLSQKLCKCLKLIQTSLHNYCTAVKNTTNINSFWIIDNNLPIIKDITILSKKNKCHTVNTYDFTTLYTTLNHTEIISNLNTLFDKTFKYKTHKSIVVYNNNAYWNNSTNNANSINKQTISEWLSWLINSTYFTFGDLIFKQIIGIPMGTDAAPYISNLHLHVYEYDFISQNIKHNPVLCKRLSHTYRYQDDITSLNDEDEFENNYTKIYPPSLSLDKVNTIDTEANVLDLDINIINNKAHIDIFDKRDAFNFNIVNFPHASSNLSNHVFTGIINSQISRYLIICSDKHKFLFNANNLYCKLQQRNYSKKFLYTTFHKALTSEKVKMKYMLTNTEIYGTLHKSNNS